MKNYFFFGFGGCGNKIIAEAIERGIIPKEQVALFNTTKKDIPAKLQEESIIFSNDADAEYGCAKNREASKQLLVQWLKTHADELDEMIPEYIDEVIIVNSTEGGTGSGGAPILARYIDEQMNIPVINIPVLGFNNDISGMQNTLAYLADISENIAILPVSNAKKNDIEDSNNFFKIEHYVNDIVIEKIKTIMGTGIVDSDQNIDFADHLKLCSNDGLMFVDTISLTKIKDTKQFNDAIINAITNSISFDIDSSLTSNHTMLGIFMNISDNKLDYIGTDFSVLKKRLFGDYSPETFFHHQNDGKDEYVRIIISGLNIPISEAKELKNMIDMEKSKVGNSTDFFEEIKSIAVEDNEPRRRRRSSGNFLDSISTEVSEETNEVLSRRGNRTSRRKPSASVEDSANAQMPKKSLSVGGVNTLIRE